MEEAESASHKLVSILGELGTAASEALGYGVVADICAGTEIEFRTLDEHGMPDEDACIEFEDIISKLKEN